jgi:predicted nuclease of restriction endonuclease-like (RecB) superfamily
MKSIIKGDYGDFLRQIKSQIRRHQCDAMRAVNRELVALYWEIGKLIHLKQQELGWGKSVVETLSADLKTEFPGRNGFSVRNLWNMREFYSTYTGHSILQPMVAELAWSKNLAIMSSCKEDFEREFYIRSTIKFGWTKAVLRTQLQNKAYEKFLLGQSSFEHTLENEDKSQALASIKDRYTFDFLELSEEHSERELENSIVSNLRNFLIELGGAFAFLGNQYRIEVGGQEFYIDLLLFHRQLRCLVAVELKVGEFKPEHKGKIEFYLEALHQQEQLEHENPPIGIVICRYKNETVVEYSLNTASKPIGIASYTTTSELPDEYMGLLPTPEEIIARLRFLSE